MGPARVTSPTLVSPALHSRGGGACAGGTVQLWAGDTSSGLFTWGGRGQQPPQAWRHGDLRSWCIGQRGDVAGKVLGGFTGGSQPLAAPPGIWVLGDPLYPPATATPRHSTDTTSGFNGGQPELQVSPHSTRHAAPSPKQHTERGWGRGNPPNPPEHTEAQQKHTARPWLRSYGGHGGVRAWLGAPDRMQQGKAPTSPRGEEGSLQAVGRQWGRGEGAAGGQTGAKLGPNWEPCSSRALPLRVRGLHPAVGGGTGDPSPRWQRGRCGAATLGGSMPERGRGGPPSLPSLTTHRKQQNQWGNTRHANQEGGSTAPPLPGEVQGKGEALGVRGDAPSPLPLAPRTY